MSISHRKNFALNQKVYIKVDNRGYNVINPNRKERLSMMNRTMNRILTGRMYMFAYRSLIEPY